MSLWQFERKPRPKLQRLVEMIQLFYLYFCDVKTYKVVNHQTSTSQKDASNTITVIHVGTAVCIFKERRMEFVTLTRTPVISLQDQYLKYTGKQGEPFETKVHMSPAIIRQ